MLLSSDFSPVSGKSKTGSSAAQAAALASGQLAACPLQPATAIASAKDGQFPLQPGVSGLMAADIASFIVVGKEAAASGRPRDAEIAFLMACQVADKLKGSASVESADARYELGSHYARLGLASSLAAAANRAELLGRAELLYSDSLHTYRLKYGQANEKSLFATQGLASVRQTLAKGDNVQRAPAPSTPAHESAANTAEPVRAAAENTSMPVQASVVRAQPRKVEVAKAALPAPQKPVAATRLRPSFDCIKARSAVEKMICSDAELARLDRELGSVYVRASNLTSDRAAFQRQTNREWRMRESTCRDRECLLRWYAQRRNQLMKGIEKRERPLPPAPRWGTGTFTDENANLYRGN